MIIFFHGPSYVIYVEDSNKEVITNLLTDKYDVSKISSIVVYKVHNFEGYNYYVLLTYDDKEEELSDEYVKINVGKYVLSNGSLLEKRYILLS